MAKDLIIRSSSAEFLIFERQTHDNGIEVRYENYTLWMTQKAIAELFDVQRPSITKHFNYEDWDFPLLTCQVSSFLFFSLSHSKLIPYILPCMPPLAMLMGAIMERDDEDSTPESVCAAALDAAEGSYQDVRKLLAVSYDDDDDED